MTFLLWTAYRTGCSDLAIKMTAGRHFVNGLSLYLSYKLSDFNEIWCTVPHFASANGREQFLNSGKILAMQSSQS